jgi:hypothetical protein
LTAEHIRAFIICNPLGESGFSFSGLAPFAAPEKKDFHAPSLRDGPETKIIQKF